jgi:hypothetical protein
VSRRGIRSALTWRGLALVGMLAGAFLVLVQTLAVEPYVAKVSRSKLLEVGRHVHGRLVPVFERVEHDLELAQIRAADGWINLEDIDSFNSWFVPYLTHVPVVSSVLLARDDGREFLLLQLPDGTWMNRITDPVSLPGNIRRIVRDAGGRTIDDHLEPSRYDPRERPWFELATRHADAQAHRDAGNGAPHSPGHHTLRMRPDSIPTGRRPTPSSPRTSRA